MDRPITAAYNIFFTNYSTNNRSVSTNDQLNSKTNHLINNSIKDGDLPDSETAPLNKRMMAPFDQMMFLITSILFIFIL